jgi:hypothetical protein
MGMLAGWSILNSVVSPRDDRFGGKQFRQVYA